MNQTTNDKRTVHCLCVGSLQTNCWIYSSPSSDTVVIDPGADAPLIIEHLKKFNLYPKYILLTHGHFDHITALRELLQGFHWESAPAVVAIHRDDASYPSSLADKPDLLLSNNDAIGPFKVIHLPGHTPGSVAFYDEAADILFTGDTLFCGNRGRTDFPGGDEALIKKSLELLLSMKGSIQVFPGHGPETTIAQEAARGLSYFM
jgi:glyoxylase-like metal-dependent hydrolase (beta-lactamase superfamily II)